MKTWQNLDELTLTNHYADLPASWYHAIEPTPLPNPRIISVNSMVAEQLKINPCSLDPQALADWLGGHTLPPGAKPLAMKYSGHQFGVYNPQLGDGRGLLLGELPVDGDYWDLHLKGAGQTRYSRMGDGRAVLRSSLREYLIGEALTHLGIPSTRALAVCVSSQKIQRERVELAATILRVSRCHIRFGHFEHLYYTRQFDGLKQLADYCLARYYPDCQSAENPYLAMFLQISQRSAEMVAGWQAYGFLHGVMNTDNMSILGETFDHGPFAFIDRWQENAVYNHTDQEGRYAFDQQPGIIQWNLSALGQALTPLVPIDDLKDALEQFTGYYETAYRQRMSARLGLATPQPGDDELIQRWRNLLAQHQADYNPLYRALSEAQQDDEGQPGLNHLDLAPWQIMLNDWLPQYRQRLQQESRHAADRRSAMLAVNPAYTLRTHVAQHLIDRAEEGDYQPLNDWLAILQNPFDEHPGFEQWRRAPDTKGLVMLSCSS